MPQRPTVQAAWRASLALLAVGLAACQDNTVPTASSPVAMPIEANRFGIEDHDLSQIKHVVVIYLENHSFDNLYGEFAGANGLNNAAGTTTQVDFTGTPYVVLPPAPGSQFPTDLPNAPFSIEQYVPANMATPDLVHRFYQEQSQIDGGKMDRFAVVSDAGGLVMGYYNTAGLPLAAEAANYTLCDNFYHSAFGGSFLNHIWLIAAASPRWPGGAAPTGPGQFAVSSMDASGHVIDGQVTADGYLVNTVYSVNTPALNFPYTKPKVPNLTMPTIGDRLSARGVSWAWYSGGWNDALAGHADPLFQFHHQPFVYFARYADGTRAKRIHLRDEEEFIAAAEGNGLLPAVSFVKPLGTENEHPGYTDLISGENHVVELINAIRNGPHWKHTAIIITYDEHGGFWDHAAPPVIDRWGPGARVPTIIISPLARRHNVDHRFYETVSILALIEHRWGLAPLSGRDGGADDLRAAFDLGRRDAGKDDDDDAPADSDPRWSGH